MNKGSYGYPLPPNAPTRIAPPEWRSYKLIKATTSVEVVPQNVYQILAMVFGGGAPASNDHSRNLEDVLRHHKVVIDSGC